jgi:hypothetical protein
MHQHLVLLFLATSEIEQAGAGGVSPNADMSQTSHSKCVGSDTVWVSHTRLCQRRVNHQSVSGYVRSILLQKSQKT